MKIEIAVVEFEGKPWFELDGIKFDRLSAEFLLEAYGEEVQVIRSGVVVINASIGQARGDLVFRGHGTDANLARHFNYSSVDAENFKPDDRLTFNVSDNFDLARVLRECFSFTKALTATMPVGESMTIDEARNRILPEMERTEEADSQVQILRFR
jgi:hypothetical protein